MYTGTACNPNIQLNNCVFFFSVHHNRNVWAEYFCLLKSFSLVWSSYNNTSLQSKLSILNLLCFKSGVSKLVEETQSASKEAWHRSECRKIPKKVPSQVQRAREKSESAVECGGGEVVECGGKEIEIAAPRKFHSSWIRTSACFPHSLNFYSAIYKLYRIRVIIALALALGSLDVQCRGPNTNLVRLQGVY